jgi:ABC-type oligopeptide transport system substrate-binding subunit
MQIPLILAALLATLSAATASVPKKVTIAVRFDHPHLDSTRAADAASGFILGHTIEGLTRRGLKDEPIPGVATHWKVTKKDARF